MKSSLVCRECGEEISVVSKNWLQDLASNAFLELKCHIHFKSHDKSLLKFEGILRRIVIIILTFLLALIVSPIWLITFPFWWIHEQIS